MPNFVSTAKIKGLNHLLTHICIIRCLFLEDYLEFPARIGGIGIYMHHDLRQGDRRLRDTFACVDINS